MIIEMFINLVFIFIDLLFKLLPDIPALPVEITEGITNFLNLLVTYGFGFLGFFVRPLTIQVVIPVLIFILNFEYVFSFIMWFIRKIPFLNIK